ncbi:transglutaminase domain-containing protein [Legionella rubrilucens]|nr:transglutaminase domain-containing protein [Legionella rubrilucens]
MTILFGMLITVVHSAWVEEFDVNQYCEYKDIFKYSACMAEHSVQGINYSMANSLSTDDLNIYRALEVMNHVQNMASPGRYAYFAKKSSMQTLSIVKPSMMLKRGYGICGNHQEMFLAIMKLFKIPSRPIDFYFVGSNGMKSSHAAVEVKIANKWRYFDISNGSIWLKESNNLSSILSIEEVIKRKAHVLSNINPWYLHFKYPKSTFNPLDYLHGKSLQIVRNKGGLLIVPVDHNQANFDGLFNYIGINDPEHPALRIKLDKVTRAMDAVINIEGIGGQCTHSVLKTSSDAYPIQVGKTLIKLLPNSELAIKGDDKLCYIVIQSIELVPDEDAQLAKSPVEYGVLKFMAHLNSYFINTNYNNSHMV